jgi:DUF1009 family protein
VTERAGSGPVAILAGSGELPRLIAERLAGSGREHRVMAFRGFAERALRARADAIVDLLDVRGIIGQLESWRPAAVTMAGAIRRPSAAAVMGAYSAVRNRDELARLMGRGDDNLLRAVVGLLEENGHTLLGVLDLAPELMAEVGTYGTLRADEGELASIALGHKLLADISPYDIGQAAILRGERVVAVEGPEGTDRMIARVAGLERRWGFRRPPRAGVLVKGPKRGQDLRVDLPTIGPRTVVNAARAGLSGIAVAAGLTLVLERGETVRLADKYGIFLMGIDGEANG